MNALTSTLALTGAFDVNAVVVDTTNANLALDTKSFRDRAMTFTDAQVTDKLVEIDGAIDYRDNAVDNGGLSWSNSRKLIVANKVAVARFFLALDLNANNVINNRLVASALFNAKALKKVVDLARFAVCDQRNIEKVLSSFIICALAFDVTSDDGAISNRHNKSFLSSIDFNLIVADSELAEYLADYQHKYMTGGKDTQSSQARRVLEVLGLGEIVNCENRSRGGIRINAEHDFYELFTGAFCK